MGKLNGTNHKTDPHKTVDFMAIQSDKKLSIIIVYFFFIPVVKLSSGRFSKGQPGLYFLPHLPTPARSLTQDKCCHTANSSPPYVCFQTLHPSVVIQSSPCFSTVLMRTQCYYNAIIMLLYIYIIKVKIYRTPIIN